MSERAVTKGKTTVSGLGKTNGGWRLVSALLMFCVALSTFIASVAAQESSPFGRSDFTSPRFGTHVEWSSEWVLDRAQSALEQRREIVVLASSTTRSAAFIELHSQRSFRTAGSLLGTFMERFTGDESFKIIDDQSASYPAAITFSFDVDTSSFEAYAQAEAVEGAMLVTAILSTSGSLEDGVAAADGILVDGRPLLNPLPICGDASSSPETSATVSPSSSSKSDSFGSSSGADTTATPKTSSSSKSESFGSKQSEEPVATPEATGGGKSDSFGDSTGEAKTDATPSNGCITLVSTSSGEPQPTPTPRSTNKNEGLNDATYRSPTFGASLRYNTNVWGVEQELVAADNNGRDSLTLKSWAQPASVIIELYAGNNGKASVCIDLALREWGISPATDDPMVDADGNPIAGTERGRVWAAYAFAYNDTELAGYVECRALPGASGVMVVTLITNPDAFPKAYADLMPILESIDTHG